MDSLEELERTYHFTRQERLLLEQAEADLSMWGMGHVTRFIDLNDVSRLSSGQQGKRILEQVRQGMEAERRKPTDYTGFRPLWNPPAKTKDSFVSEDVLWGRCPCPTDGKQTRCCNLRTLDAVQGCMFDCAYCAVQSFYQQGEVRFVDNLAQRLSDIRLPEEVWHIGTGQSSDSLAWGDDHGTLAALRILARRYPEKVIELKTKSARTDWITDDWPRNIIATWSLNAPVIQQAEEHFTASIAERIKAARIAADHHILVGFHFHPMVWFDGWQEGYRQVVEMVTSSFRTEEVALVSFGTLTFTKSVLKTLREAGRPSRILDMDLVPFAGKFSYPWETKRDLFCNVWNAFPASWKTGSPFFYLCFEDPTLWQPVFGHSYASNEEFEAAMKKSYLSAIHRR